MVKNDYLERVLKARVYDVAIESPLELAPALSKRLGNRLYIKREDLQPVFSFKLRGAYNKMAGLPRRRLARGVIAASAGNHAQGVALAAARLGCRALIVMPVTTPRIKVDAVAARGARVLLHGDSYAEAYERAMELKKQRGLVFVHPYDDPEVIAGQGTIGMEILRQHPDPHAIFVPVGGGGLISGIATAAKALKPSIRILGVESRNYPSMHQRLAGLPVECGGDTIAEGIAVKDVGATALEIIRRLVDEVLIVEEETIERAVVALIEIEKTVAEGAGAAGLAALLQHRARFAGHRVGIPISGGNIDSRVLASVLMRGLVRDGRLVRLRVTMPDVSGSLAKVAMVIAEAGGNIVEIQHQRLFGTSSVRSPEVEFLVETRDREHTDALVRALQEKNVKVSAS